MKDDDKPRVNPYVMLREEFDDWAVLFDPDTGHGFGLSPTGVYVWKLLDGEHTMDGLLENIRHRADNVPEDAGVHIGAFVDALVAEGLAGFDPNLADGITPRPEACASPPPGASGEAKTFNYEPPRLINLSSGHTIVKNNGKPIVNPHVVLREEFDDWAVLFNPAAVLGYAGFGLNPTGVYLWKLLDGERTIDGLLEELREHAQEVPGDAREHIRLFLDALVAEGLVACGDAGSYREESSHAPLAPLTEVTPFTYEPPKLVNLGSGQSVLGDCSGHGSHGGDCSSGAGATGCCTSGTCGTDYGSCCTGYCGTAPDCCGCGNCQAYSHCDFNCGTGTCPNYFCESGTTAGNDCTNGNGTYRKCAVGTGVG